MNYSDLKTGHILSENSFFTVNSVEANGVECTTDDGQTVRLGRRYVESIMQSGDLYSSEEEKTMTELADIFINTPRVAMTVAYFKKDKKKGVRAYKKEVAEAVERVKNATVGTVESVVLDLIDNPITKVIPGELRVMRGRHYRSINDLGRVSFIDMEVTDPIKGDYDPRVKQVDPRTIQYLIVNDVKYTLKK